VARAAHLPAASGAIAKQYPGQWATTANESYQFPKPKDRPVTSHQRPLNKSHPFEGQSTHMADYVKWPLPSRADYRPPTAPDAKHLPFAGTSIHHESFMWPMKDRTRPHIQKFPKADPQPFNGESEDTAKYTQLKLPAGMPCSLGLQIASKPYVYGGVGGQFLTMIPAGTPTPCIASKMLTTVVDMQDRAKIVVIAKRDGDLDGVELGHFSMDGIRPTKLGTQTVNVTFKLMNEQTMQVTAMYRQGNRKINLQFRDAMPLRTLAQPR